VYDCNDFDHRMNKYRALTTDWIVSFGGCCSGDWYSLDGSQTVLTEINTPALCAAQGSGNPVLPRGWIDATNFHKIKTLVPFALEENAGNNRRAFGSLQQACEHALVENGMQVSDDARGGCNPQFVHAAADTVTNPTSGQKLITHGFTSTDVWNAATDTTDDGLAQFLTAAGRPATDARCETLLWKRPPDMIPENQVYVNMYVLCMVRKNNGACAIRNPSHANARYTSEYATLRAQNRVVGAPIYNNGDVQIEYTDAHLVALPGEWQIETQHGGNDYFANWFEMSSFLANPKWTNIDDEVRDSSTTEGAVMLGLNFAARGVNWCSTTMPPPSPDPPPPPSPPPPSPSPPPPLAITCMDSDVEVTDQSSAKYLFDGTEAPVGFKAGQSYTMNIPAAHPIQFVGASGASVTCQHGVNMVCTDTGGTGQATYSYSGHFYDISDGTCQDGGYNSAHKSMPTGSDCTDCGGRCCLGDVNDANSVGTNCNVDGSQSNQCICHGATEGQVVSSTCTVTVTLLAGGAQPYGNDYYTGAIRVAFSSQCADTDVQINCYNHGAMSSFLRHDDTCTNAVLSPSPPPPSYDYRDSNLHTYTNCLSLPLYPFI
jgi:hypothetical protein